MQTKYWPGFILAGEDAADEQELQPSYALVAIQCAAESRDAARGDMALIATRGAGELPTEVKAWIDEWLAQNRKARENQRTLAALFDALPNTVGIPALAQFAYLQWVGECKSRAEFLGGRRPRSRSHGSLFKSRLKTSRKRESVPGTPRQRMSRER